MIDFEQEKYQILVCTTIIETGLDIANANTMIIDDADRLDYRNCIRFVVVWGVEKKSHIVIYWCSHKKN